MLATVWVLAKPVAKACRGQNPKAEDRNPKNGISNSGFGFRPSFGLRPSDFGFVMLVTFGTAFGQARA